MYIYIQVKAQRVEHTEKLQLEYTDKKYLLKMYKYFGLNIAQIKRPSSVPQCATNKEITLVKPKYDGK